ncbi:MAG TPA: putative toxin-antitoxin system toxin component, PIN family [Candidatus Acidoferrales bacterium]|nr:putative toxin-antitoxin system toxin component, PIN family [Candidatus Acidoferrales bacterium]
MRLVLDTSVLVAAVRSSLGASRQLLIAGLKGRYSLLVSVPLMMEYQAVLLRQEHLEAGRVSAAAVEEILKAVASVAVPVRLAYLWRPMLRDPDDEMVLETAVNGAADYLCTLNTRDFAPAGQFGIAVVSPGKAWRLLEKSHEEK